MLNRASGSHDDERAEKLVHWLERAGHEPARIVDCSEQGLPDRATLEAAGVGLLAVHGGDGTLNAAITGVEGWDGDVLALPGGTANLLCRSLYGDAEIDDVLEQFAGGALRLCRRQVVRGRDWIALAEVLAGPGAAWADVREDLRDGDLAELLSGAIDAASLSTAGPMVAIHDPSLGREEGYAGVRLVPGGEGMAVEGYGAAEFGDYLKQALAILGRDFRSGPHDELGTHRRVVCRMADNVSIPLMVDGERRDGAMEERFDLAEFAANLFCRADG
ncbi:acylglycerol kinase family protein [Croceicoccus estronivorus]|uniref:acylglycerol kinase family protein n=1 Tax=Croceicoccus estronivorus TaxID=1172626 RepID=UPI001F179722|nr:acylglycerol kinase family protein [Croceicoccus estronivorus]